MKKVKCALFFFFLRGIWLLSVGEIEEKTVLENGKLKIRFCFLNNKMYFTIQSPLGQSTMP